jgi:hypothetical protein
VSQAEEPAGDGTGGGGEAPEERPRRRFELDDRGFNEVPAKYRKFYRRREGPGDRLGPNEVLCPVCKVIVRSPRELREGDRIYCMACMTRLRVSRAGDGLEARPEY